MNTETFRNAFEKFSNAELVIMKDMFVRASFDTEGQDYVLTCVLIDVCCEIILSRHK
jgi:hypothetical protein